MKSKKGDISIETIIIWTIIILMLLIIMVIIFRNSEAMKAVLSKITGAF
ncbi:hypothetical protein KY311_04720 [Candidatus Woesearchaeota archaeon]|nr:hypothetical protein [Candidatus Woesearchaeota archaeon]